jgi:hypothetical protein
MPFTPRYIFPQSGQANYHLWVTIQHIRLANLRLLVTLFGTPRAAADLSDTSEGYLKEILRGDTLPSGKAKSVGDDLARKLEKGCGKPEGWMDVSHQGESQTPPGELLTPEDRALLTLYRRADPELKAAIMQVAKLAK